uniref:Uncharacterized protein n=1 Tax=Rhizochromulina marina TaxID=1034831 RepID=A0A7S2WDZ0_9STRA|mmetsp:Transcript_21831/g.63521  ORF Transcript_21831/g.63521 Transcript_21831/m.63521 type:complete len:101 (+) Transcript_21831:477-779(+)
MSLGAMGPGQPLPDGVKFSNPGLSAGQWWQYLTNVAKISPIPKDMKFGDVPQGVLRLGGTFVVDRGEVIYSRADKIPGDHPDVGEVLQIALQAAKANSDP